METPILQFCLILKITIKIANKWPILTFYKLSKQNYQTKIKKEKINKDKKATSEFRHDNIIIYKMKTTKKQSTIMWMIS